MSAGDDLSLKGAGHELYELYSTSFGGLKKRDKLVLIILNDFID